MTRRDAVDERIFAPRKPVDGFAGLPLGGIEGGTERGVCEVGRKAPSTIHLPAPSAPGSDTSRDAAELVSVDSECLRCLQWYAKQTEPKTRYDLAAAVYPVVPGKRDVMGIGPACGRTNALVTLGYLEEVGRIKKRATLRVTEAGRRWLAKRQAA